MNSIEVGKYAATQSVAEIGLGSIVHGLHLPFGGHLLSLNQGLILTLATKKAQHRRTAVSQAVGISSVAALLKALSPMGKRLMPMFAISTQGLLFSTGIALLGLNIFGISLGLVLLSFWGFIQPVFVAYLLFGGVLFEAIEKLWLEAAKTLNLSPSLGVWILLSVVAIKVIAALAIAFLGWRANENFEKTYLDRINVVKEKHIRNAKPHQKQSAPIQGAISDLLNPWYLVGLLVSVGLLIVSGKSSRIEIWFYALRTLAVGWLFFWALRAFPRRWINLGLKKFPQIESALSQVFRR